MKRRDATPWIRLNQSRFDYSIKRLVFFQMLLQYMHVKLREDDPIHAHNRRMS